MKDVGLDGDAAPALVLCHHAVGFSIRAKIRKQAAVGSVNNFKTGDCGFDARQGKI